MSLKRGQSEQSKNSQGDSENLWSKKGKPPSKPPNLFCLL